MFILEFGQVVDIFVNNDPEVVWLVMRRYVTLREDLGHHEGESNSNGEYKKEKKKEVVREKEKVGGGMLLWHE
jgi:hypothetical protein